MEKKKRKITKHKEYHVTGLRDRLEQAIWDSGMGLSEICQKAEISRTMLWGYRFDGITPNARAIYGLCKALGISADYLLGLEEQVK